MNAVELETERLLLKPLTTNHLSDNYVSWLNDHEVNKYLETRGGYTLEKLKLFLIDQEKKDIFFWAIHLKDSFEHIGNIKIDPLNFKDNSGEYGILMGSKEHWGKGYAKEASQVIIEFCFKVLFLKKINLGVIENNESAVSLYKKLGFNTYQVIQKYGYYDDNESNLIRMTLINRNEE